MDAKWMLLAMLAQVLLTGYVTVVMRRRRVHAVTVEGLDPLYFKTREVGEPPRKMLQADLLFENLFETPVIFFAGGLAAMALGLVDEVLLVLASLYVVCRIMHANEVLGRNSIRKRFPPWTVSLFTLAGFWLWLTFKAFI
jgi:hypothetical protein